MTQQNQRGKLSGIDKTFIVLTLVSDAMFGAERGLALHGMAKEWQTVTLVGHMVGQAMFGLLVGATLINAISALSLKPHHKGLWASMLLTVFTVIISTIEAVYHGKYTPFGVGCAVIAPYASAIALTLASHVKGNSVIDDMVAILRSKIAEIEKALQASEDEVAPLTAKLQAKDDMIARLQRDLQASNNKIALTGNHDVIVGAKDREIVNLTASIERLKDAAKNTAVKHSNEMQAKDTTIAGLNAEIASMRGATNPLQGDLQASQSEVATLRDMVARLQSEVTEYSKPLDQRIADMAKQGMSAQAIADKVGLSRQAVAAKLKEG